MIRLGVCTSYDRLSAVKAAGFDYAEIGLSALQELSEDDFHSLKNLVLENGFPVLCANSMLPGRFSLYTEEGVLGALSFLESAYKRAAELGIRTVVFGSGQARQRPGSIPEEEAYRCLAAFLKQASRIAEKNGIRIAIEPLRKEECNILNSVEEGRKLAALAGEEDVCVLADLYHMMAGGEDIDTLLKEPHVIHTHIAEKEKRTFPKKEDVCTPVYEQFFRDLKETGYEGGVSVEGMSEDFEKDLKEAFQLLDALRNE